MAGLGIVGYLLRKQGVPMAPLILGFVLGDLMEQNLRRALSITNGELGKLLPAFTRDFAASGTLSANVSYALQSKTFAALFANPRVDANFNVEKGALNNVDIVRAIQSPARDGVRGGNTKFDVLAGSLQVVGNHYSYRQLRLNSGPMNASGSFDVAPEGDLSGRIIAEVGSKSVIVARGMLNVAGNLKVGTAARRYVHRAAGVT